MCRQCAASELTVLPQRIACKRFRFNYYLVYLFKIKIPHFSHKTFPEAICTSPNNLREEIKRLKMMELQLKDGIQELSQHRNCLVMELQQLQEAKPAIEKAYAVRNY